MFKLVVLAALVAVAVAEPGYYASPAIGFPVATSYANTYRAPVVKAYASAPYYAAQPAALTYTSGASLYNAAPYPYISGAYIH